MENLKLKCRGGNYNIAEQCQLLIRVHQNDQVMSFIASFCTQREAINIGQLGDRLPKRLLDYFYCLNRSHVCS